MSTIPQSANAPKSAVPGGVPKTPRSVAIVEEWIEEVRRALWTADLTRALLWTLGVFAGIWLGWILVDHWVLHATVWVRVTALMTLVMTLAMIAVRKTIPLWGGRIDPSYAAHAIEVEHPQLRQSLTTYVSLRDGAADAGLRGSVVRGLATKSAIVLQQEQRLPTEATGLLRNWIGVLVLFVVLMAYWALAPKSAWLSTKRLFVPWADLAVPTRVQIQDIRPGDISVLAGRPVLFQANVSVLGSDERVICRWFHSQGHSDLEMFAADPAEPEYSGTLPLDDALSGEVRYRILAGDARSREHRLRVRDVPVVQIESLTLRPPEYTKQLERVQSNGAIRGIDGTRVTIRIRGSRPLRRAVIEFNPKSIGGEVRATAGAVEMKRMSDMRTNDNGVDMPVDGRPLSFTHSLVLRAPGARSTIVPLESYRIKVWDEEDQTNPQPIVYPIHVVTDLPPEVSIVLPQQSPKKVPRTSQQMIEVHAIDPDFGLHDVQLKIQRNGRTVQEPVLWSANTSTSTEQTAGVLSGEPGNQIGDFGIRPERLECQAGDVLRIWAIARDNRSSASDESVRPNVAQSDPIELQIVDDGPVPPQDQNENDGLTEPNANEEPQNEGAGRDSTQQNPPEDSKAQKQQDDGEGGGGTGGQEDAGGGTGAGGESGTQDESQEPGSEGQPSGGQNGSPSSDSENSSDQPMDDAASDAGQRDSSSGSSGGTASNESDQGAESDQDANASEGSGAGGTEGGSSAGQPNGGDPSSSSSQPPSHDGEAIERIMDYLNEKNEGETGQRTGDRPQNRDDPKADRDPAQGASPEHSAGETPGTPESATGDPNTGDGSSPDERSENEKDRRGGAGDGQDRRPNDNRSRPDASSKGTEAGNRNEPSRPSDAGPSQDGSRGSDSTMDSQSRNEKRSDMEPQGDAGATHPNQGEKPENASEGAKPVATPGGQPSDDARPAQNGGGEAPGDGQVTDESAADAPQGKGGSKPLDSSNARPSDGADGKANPGSGANDLQPSDASSSGAPGDGGSSGQSQSSRDPDDGPFRTGGDRTGASLNGNLGSAPGPDPVDVEYAKKATDLVLDYLDQTRESPDPELLEKLNWTEQDLARFRERWKRMRDLNQPAIESVVTPEWEDTLKSLGIRDSKSRQSRRQSLGDASQSLNDSGSRSDAPAVYRDAFEAFRRNVGRGASSQPQ